MYVTRVASYVKSTSCFKIFIYPLPFPSIFINMTPYFITSSLFGWKSIFCKYKRLYVWILPAGNRPKREIRYRYVLVPWVNLRGSLPRVAIGVVRWRTLTTQWLCKPSINLSLVSLISTFLEEERWQINSNQLPRTDMN